MKRRQNKYHQKAFVPGFSEHAAYYAKQHIFSAIKQFC